MIPSISRGPCGGTDGSSPLGPRRSTAAESSESGFTTRLAATTDKRAAKTRERTSQAREADGGELGRHRVTWRRRVQVAHDEKPLPVREGSFDPGTVLDASTGRAGFLVGEPIAIGDDHRSRRGQSRFDAMAHRLRIRLATIAQIRRGRVEQAKADLRKLGGGEDRRSVRDRRAIEDIEQCGHPARKLQQEPLLDLGKLLPALEAEVGEHGGHHPLKAESEDHRNDDREPDGRGNAVRAPHHQGAPLRVTSAVKMYPSLRIVLISAGSLGSASRRWRSRLM